MANNILVSIITPVYNASEFLEETLLSVISQTYGNWEHLLVDDCSTDHSLDILKQYSIIDNRFKIYENSDNRGSGYTRNRAIEMAMGRYIAFLDSDDLWHPEKLSLHIAFMHQNNSVFSHSSYGYIDENSQKIKNTFHVSRLPVTYYDLLKRTEISCLTAMYDAESIGKFYMSDHQRKQDYALWLSILKVGHRSHGLDEELAYYRQHEGSATSNKFDLLGKHVAFLKETQGFNTPTALYYTAYWLVNGIIRYYLK
jgi:teichuronic acid biosynthesis glycosyltransferase TuaG